MDLRRKAERAYCSALLVSEEHGDAMMGSRNNSNDGSYEVFTRRLRRKVGSYRPGVVKYVKRMFWKRERKAAQRVIRTGDD